MPCARRTFILGLAPRRLRRLTVHVFAEGDEYLNLDAVFATKSSLVGRFEHCDDTNQAESYKVRTPFTKLEFDFGLMRT